MLCPVVFLGRADEAERQARAALRGLWADKAPVSPWELRASEKDRKGEPMGTR
jgi:endonuclease YncB( thermonuclease family)